MRHRAPRTVRECLDRWLAAKRATVREPTWLDYREKSARYITPRLGAVLVAGITPLRLEGFYHELAAGGLSTRTVWYVHEILLQVLDHAVHLGVLVMNPARQGRPPRYLRSNSAGLSPAQLTRFLMTAACTEHAALWFLLAEGGLRPSEALALTWDCVNIEQAWAKVESVLRSLGNGRWGLYPLRHAGQHREITLSQGARDALAAERRHQASLREAAGAAWIEHGLVFTGPGGEPLDWKRVTRRHFHALLIRAGLPPVAPYSLRHSCITALLGSGMDIQAVSRQLGYTSLTRMLESAQTDASHPDSQHLK